jgi:hypothetical protein
MFDYQFLLIILGYAFLGGGLKYIDQAYDEKVFSKTYAKILALVLGFVMAYLMAVDTPFSTSYLGAMIVGVVAAKKIDNFPFKVVVLGTIFFLYLLSFSYSFWLDATLFISFIIVSFLDEIVERELPKRVTFSKFLKTFFQLRPLNDGALIGLIIMGLVNWVYLIPFYAFFIAYYEVEKISEKRLKHA